MSVKVRLTKAAQNSRAHLLELVEQQLVGRGEDLRDKVDVLVGGCTV